MLKRTSVFLALASFLALPVPALAQERGGIINVAIAGEPTTIDPMSSTADIVTMVSQHVFETLFTMDSSWQPAPLLATDLPEISEDGTLYRIALREGIQFHDGSVMTSSDVVASLERWLRLAPRGRQTAPRVASVSALDDHTIEITLDQPYPALTTLLSYAGSAAAIMRQDHQPDTLEEYIGTGAYMLQDRRADQYIQLVRFDGYQSRTEPSDSYAGTRNAWADEIIFFPVPDPNTRIELAISGQYDYVDQLPIESISRITGPDALKPVLMEDSGVVSFNMNMRQGISTDIRVRKAVQAALHIDDMLVVAFGDPRFYKTAPSHYPDTYYWHSMAGSEGVYNQADIEKSRALLEEAGVVGQKMRILTSRAYDFHYKMSLVAAENLRSAGLDVTLDVVDWATLVQKRADPAEWDIFITHGSFLADPVLNGTLFPGSPNGWDTPKRAEAVGAFASETDRDRRLELWHEVQALLHEEVPQVLIGSFAALRGVNSDLDGVPLVPSPFFWNAERMQ